MSRPNPNPNPSPNPNPTRALTLKTLFQHRRKHPDFNLESLPRPLFSSAVANLSCWGAFYLNRNYFLKVTFTLRKDKNLHRSVLTGEEVQAGCEKLPELTAFWPFHLWPSDITATLVDTFQQSSGLPWWATICVAGAAVKLPMFGFNVYNYRSVQQFVTTQPRVMGHFVMVYLNNLVTKGEQHALKMANNERRFTILREGMNTEVSMKATLRTHIYYLPIYYLAGAHLAMVTGFMWLNRIQYVPLTLASTPWSSAVDLTVCDPTLILPSICLAAVAVHLYFHPLTHFLPVPSTRTFLSPSYIPLLAPPLIVTFAALCNIPSDILIYIISTTITSTLMGLSLRHEAVSRAVGLLSGGEVMNRLIPPASTVKEFSVTLKRQDLLLEQRDQQLLEAKERLLLKEQERDKVEELESGLEEDEEKKLEDERDVRFVKKKTLSPALNVHKKFDV
eukprot:sb/3464662/